MEKIGIVLGRFSGPHLGHVSLLKKSINENDKTYLVIITGNKTSMDKDRNPLSFEVKKELFQYNFPNIIITEYSRGYIPDILKDLDIYGYKVYGDITIYCGEDNFYNYTQQVKYLPGIDVVKMDRNIIDVSGTQIRDLIRTNELEKVRKLMPNMSDELFDRIVSEIKVTGKGYRIKEMWNKINDKYNKN